MSVSPSHLSEVSNVSRQFLTYRKALENMGFWCSVGVSEVSEGGSLKRPFRLSIFDVRQLRHFRQMKSLLSGLLPNNNNKNSILSKGRGATLQFEDSPSDTPTLPTKAAKALMHRGLRQFGSVGALADVLTLGLCARNYGPLTVTLR